MGQKIFMLEAYNMSGPALLILKNKLMVRLHKVEGVDLVQIKIKLKGQNKNDIRPTA